MSRIAIAILIICTMAAGCFDKSFFKGVLLNVDPAALCIEVIDTGYVIDKVELSFYDGSLWKIRLEDSTKAIGNVDLFQPLAGYKSEGVLSDSSKLKDFSVEVLARHPETGDRCRFYFDIHRPGENWIEREMGRPGSPD